MTVKKSDNDGLLFISFSTCFGFNIILILQFMLGLEILGNDFSFFTVIEVIITIALINLSSFVLITNSDFYTDIGYADKSKSLYVLITSIIYLMYVSPAFFLFRHTLSAETTFFMLIVVVCTLIYFEYLVYKSIKKREKKRRLYQLDTQQYFEDLLENIHNGDTYGEAIIYMRQHITLDSKQMEQIYYQLKELYWSMPEHDRVSDNIRFHKHNKYKDFSTERTENLFKWDSFFLPF
jgi:hypothetical protein